MDIGMLWFDNRDQDDFGSRVGRAAQFYQKKYGKAPNLCFVNPKTGEEGKFGGVEVRNSTSLLTNHFWIGVNK